MKTGGGGGGGTQRILGAYPGTWRIPSATRAPGAYPAPPGAYPAHTRAPGAYPDGHHLQYSGSLFPSTLGNLTGLHHNLLARFKAELFLCQKLLGLHLN